MWNQSPPPKNSLVAFYEFLKCVHSRGATKGPLFFVLFRVVFPIPPCKKMFLHKCCVIRGVEQVKKSDNHNLFQFQNLTKPLKIGDFTVYPQVNNCMCARFTAPVADQLADYPT